MTEAEARARLESMLQWDAEPALSATEVEALLSMARRADEYGLGPDDDGWTETWDLRHAAAEGWTWKAGKVAGEFAFGTDSQSFQRQQVREACLDMARRYGRRGVTSTPLVSTAVPVTDIIENINV